MKVALLMALLLSGCGIVTTPQISYAQKVCEENNSTLSLMFVTWQPAETVHFKCANNTEVSVTDYERTQ